MLTTRVQTRHQIKCHNNREDLVAEQSIKGRNVWNGKYLEGEAIFSAEEIGISVLWRGLKVKGFAIFTFPKECCYNAQIW